MSDWTLPLAFVSVLAMTVGLLALAWRRGRLGMASVALLLFAFVTWGLDVLAIATGFNDADGFVDCEPNCTFMHRLAVLGFVASPLLVSIAAAGMGIALLSRARARRRGA